MCINFYTAANAANGVYSGKNWFGSRAPLSARADKSKSPRHGLRFKFITRVSRDEDTRFLLFSTFQKLVFPPFSAFLPYFPYSYHRQKKSDRKSPRLHFYFFFFYVFFYFFLFFFFFGLNEKKRGNRNRIFIPINSIVSGLIINSVRFILFVTFRKYTICKVITR